MKTIITLSILFLLTGCVKQKPQVLEDKRLDKKVIRKNHVANEFIYAGEKQVLAAYLKKAGAPYELIAVGSDSYQVKYSGEVSLEQIQNQLSSLPGVRYVEPNFKYEPNDKDYDRRLEMSRWTNDKFFLRQWGLNNIGQEAPYGLPGTRKADIDMLKAWEVVTGSKDIVVAVIDTGIDYTHPDLKENMWVNRAEADGVAGRDDDHNGYVDDIYGYDFVSANQTQLWYGQPGDADPMDVDGHGTHCAGSIGAQSNNSLGMTGVNWNVQLMAVRGLSGSGGTSADLARAIRYATLMKVDVMSNSWGGTGKSELIREAVLEAEQQGIVFVAASGNSSANVDTDLHYPSSYKYRDNSARVSNIISVGASDNQDNAAGFSNYGYENVDIFAPGVAILSTYPTSKVKDPSRAYAIMSGTSMATPLVSGVVALMLAANPSLKGHPELVRRILIDTADQVPSLVGKSKSNGRLNAANAVRFRSEQKTPLSNWLEKPLVISQRGFHSELVDIKKKVHIPNAKALQVHFDFVQINEPYDSLYIYDGQRRYIGSLSQLNAYDTWSPIVPGDTMYVRFVNSHLKRINMSPAAAISTEVSCLDDGGEFENGVCRIDSKRPLSEGGTEEFISFNSEGYSIDRVKYILDEGGQR